MAPQPQPDINRLKAQLLTAGLQQRNTALFQVIDQLIDAIRSMQIGVFGVTGTSGVAPSGAQGILSNATVLTVNDETGLFPNSVRLLAGQDIEFNDKESGRRTIGARVPLFVPSESHEEFIPPPAINDFPGPYVELTDTTSQQPAVTTPVQITFNTEGLIYGFTHSGGDLTCLEAGNYLVIFTGQIGETANGHVNVDVWFRINTTDVVNSNNRNFVAALTDSKVITVDAILRLEKNDVFKCYMSVDDATRGAGLITISPTGEPVIPGAMVLLHKVSR